MRKQGTVKSYDASSHTGVILDDEKNEYTFGPDSYTASGLREFRLGQRVKFTLAGEAPKVTVRDLNIVSF